MANARPVNDGLTNLVANLGTDRDKASWTTYAYSPLSDHQLQAAYRSAWLPRKIVDIPALDASRKWRDWQAEAKEIETVEAEEKRLGLRQKVRSAIGSARLFGRSALLIGTGEEKLAEPLDVDRVKRGGLKYVTVLHKRQFSAAHQDDEPASEWFGGPDFWRIGGKKQVDIHASRLVIFRGAEIIDPGLSGSAGEGDSVLASVFEAVRNMDAAAANIASLLFEAKVDTVGIPDLMVRLSDPGFEAALLSRLRLAEMGKGINGAFIHDASEVLGQKTASFGSLPELLDRFMTIVSGAADIPATRLMGQSPSGMSATGESDIRNYYDRVSAMQETEIGPAMFRLDECLIRSALGSRPDEIHYRWGSLWQVSDKERADIGKVQADTAKVLRDTQLVPDEALSRAVVTALTESGAMPGLEGAVADYEAESPEEEPDPIRVVERQEEEPENTGDAEPRTLYVMRPVLNAKEIIAWAKGQGFDSTLPPEDMHVTIAFSKARVDWMKVGQAWEGKIELPEGGPRLVEALGQNGESKALLFSSNELKWRNESIREAGASWDWPDYQPHITISYGPLPDGVEPYQGKIVLGPEQFAEIDDDWKAKVSQK